MDYEFAIKNKSERVRITRAEEPHETYRIEFPGREKTVHMLSVVKREPSRLVISIGDRLYSVSQLGRDSISVRFILNGEEIVAELKTMKPDMEIGSDVASVDEIVTSNFPAKVVKVFASKGKKLRKGDTLIIVEAMKMEAQIKSPRDCTVLETFVKEGDMISGGSRIARLKFDK